MPTGVNATPTSSSQINLSWTASSDNVAVTGYAVERCQGSSCNNFAEIATPASTSYSDTGRSPSTIYRYRVRARDAVPNYSSYSTIASATTPAAPASPTPPAGLTATAISNKEIDLAWTASSGGAGVTGYRIERCQGAGCANFSQIGTSTSTAFFDPGLVAATSYSYRVRAVDAANNLSNYSTVFTTATLAAAACD